MPCMQNMLCIYDCDESLTAIDNNEATKESIYWSASSGNVLLNNTMNSGATKLEQEIHILSS